MLRLHRRARAILPFEVIVRCGPKLLSRVSLRRWLKRQARLQRRHVCGVRGLRVLRVHRRARVLLPFVFIVCCGPDLLIRVLLRRWLKLQARLQRRHVCGVRGVCVLQLHRRAREILLFVFIVRCGLDLLIRAFLRRRLKRQARLQSRHVCGIRGLRVLQLHRRHI